MTRRFITGGGIGEAPESLIKKYDVIHKVALKIAARAKLGNPMTDDEMDALYDLELGKLNNVKTH